MVKQIEQTQVSSLPDGAERVFEIVKDASAFLAHIGESAFYGSAIFGGAVRDSDYASRHGSDHTVNDYDVRIWLPPEQYDTHVDQFISTLYSVTNAPIRETPSAGTGRVRYCVDIDELELDISIRPGIANKPETVAIERAGDGDIGISSVAVAPNLTVWAPNEYAMDRDDLTLSVYPPHGTAREKAYTARMQQKFPNHLVVMVQ